MLDESAKIRLELVKVVVPQATRVGLLKTEVVDICSQLENYVIGSYKQGVEKPATPEKRGPGRPPKNQG